MKLIRMLPAALMLCAAGALACGGDDITNPVDIPFGQTTLVVVANPVLNTLNQGQFPDPGSARVGITVTMTNGPIATTNAQGVAVLGPFAPGERTIGFSGGGTTGQLDVNVLASDLKEIAVALSGSGASLMTEVRYAFGGEVVEITPAMAGAQVNAELARSNIIVFFRSGSYSGDLELAGSNVTLFGEGPQGGAVTLNGDVAVPGSRNRIRGARIAGSLTVLGSDFGMSFSRVDGAFTLIGSGGVLLQNRLCGPVEVSGSTPTLLGNTGLEPLSPGC